MAMTEQRVSYTLDSSLETIDNAEEKATRIATELGFPDDEIMQISMAVREAAVNAVLHGNAYAPDKKVILVFERTGGDLVITIRDQGLGSIHAREAVTPRVKKSPQAPTPSRSRFGNTSFRTANQFQPQFRMDRDEQLHP